jgi:hypothetical protein
VAISLLAHRQGGEDILPADRIHFSRTSHRLVFLYRLPIERQVEFDIGLLKWALQYALEIIKGSGIGQGACRARFAPVQSRRVSDTCNCFLKTNPMAQ